ncbi:MAG: TIGR00269 family protein [archaeon]
MLCHCGNPAVIETLCREHFLESIERKVKETIDRFNLIMPNDKILVAASGGKDSMTLALILHKLQYTFDILAIDEGIPGYREHTLSELLTFCKQQGFPPPNVVSFKDVLGDSLQELLQSHKPCTVCGTFRRYLLNKYAKGYDKLATGHNLDDEAQTILMNVYKGQPFLLAKLGPITKANAQFTRRIKPLYFCTERETRAYAFLNNLPLAFHECPYTHESYRDAVRSVLNNAEQQSGMKRNIVNAFLVMHERLREERNLRQCERCGEASSGRICKACQLLDVASAEPGTES